MRDLGVKKLAAQPKFAEDKKMEKYVRKCQENFEIEIPTRWRRHTIILRRLTTTDPLRSRRLYS